MTAIQAKVTSNGQISLPAEVRHRWRVSSVLVIDLGDYAIVRPVPADPISALRGKYARPGPSLEAIRADERAEEAEAEDRRWAEQ